MKKSSYMSKNELISFLKLDCLCGEIAEEVTITPVPEWRKKMKTVVTMMDNLLKDRLKCLEPEQLVSVARRKEYTKIILSSEDKDRFGVVEKEIVKCDMEDIETLAELALNSCLACKEGDCVKDCRFRLAMHRLGLEVANDEPEKGKCEYKMG